MIKLIDLLKEEDGPKCPVSTQNSDVNAKHRQIAIDEYSYGPKNPNNPNVKFWKAKAQLWKLQFMEEAKDRRCNSCAYFNITMALLNCIEKGNPKTAPIEPEANPNPNPAPEQVHESNDDIDNAEDKKAGSPFRTNPKAAVENGEEPETDDTQEQGGDSWDSIEAGKCGYCMLHKFKSTGSRTCSGYRSGGPKKE